MKYHFIMTLPQINDRLKYDKQSIDSYYPFNSIIIASKTPKYNRPITQSTLFHTQISHKPLTASSNKKPIPVLSRNSKHCPLYLYKRQLKNKLNIDDSLIQITNQNNRLKTSINSNPYISFSFKDYLKNSRTLDPTITTIKGEIKSLGKEIDKKGMFLTISKNNSNINDTKAYTKIFVSENNDNIYSKTKQADLLNPLSVLKFKKRFEKEYNINQRKIKLIRDDNRAHSKFLQAYNQEVHLKKRIEKMYKIKSNERAHYITSL